MPMSPFPEDLPRRTERALNLLAAAGVTDVSADIWEGDFEPSTSHQIFGEWGLPKELEVELSGTFLHREILGGGTLHELCMEVIRDWTRTWGEMEGTFRLDPYEGLTFTSDNHDPEEEDPKPILLHRFRSEIARDPAVWVEWATSDWAHHGFTDMTSWMVETWVDEEGCLSGVIQEGFPPGVINDQMPADEMDEKATRQAIEHLWAQEDAGNTVTFEERDVSPHALLLRMLERPSGRKVIQWLAGWERILPEEFPPVERGLVRHVAARASVLSRSASSSPSPS